VAYRIRVPSVPERGDDWYCGECRHEIPRLPWGRVPIVSRRGPTVDYHPGYRGYGMAAPTSVTLPNRCTDDASEWTGWTIAFNNSVKAMYGNAAFYEIVQVNTPNYVYYKFRGDVVAYGSRTTPFRGCAAYPLRRGALRNPGYQGYGMFTKIGWNGEYVFERTPFGGPYSGYGAMEDDEGPAEKKVNAAWWGVGVGGAVALAGIGLTHAKAQSGKGKVQGDVISVIAGAAVGLLVGFLKAPKKTEVEMTAEEQAEAAAAAEQEAVAQATAEQEAALAGMFVDTSGNPATQFEAFSPAHGTVQPMCAEGTFYDTLQEMCVPAPESLPGLF